MPAGRARKDSLDHFQQLIDFDGQIIGCFYGKQLIAYGVLNMHCATLVEIALQLGFWPSQRERLCLLDGAATSPHSRGQGLHGQSISMRIAIAKRMGRSLLLATVSPANTASLRGLLRKGFLVMHAMQLYGGLERLVLVLDLRRASSATTRDASAFGLARLTP